MGVTERSFLKNPHGNSEVFLKIKLLSPHEDSQRSTPDWTHPSSELRISQQTQRPLVLPVSPESTTGKPLSPAQEETPGAR